jgi:hypothetical protein
MGSLSLCYLWRMEFSELVALLQNPGDDGLPETIYDDLSSSYQLAVDGGAASVAERDASIEALTAEIASLKALNFDLLMAANAGDSTDDTNNPTDDAPETGGTTIESLFE